MRWVVIPQSLQMRKENIIPLLFILFLYSCIEKQNDSDFKFYDEALDIIFSNPNPSKLVAWSDTTCNCIPDTKKEDMTMQAAIYPNVIYFGSDIAANYNRGRTKACSEFGKPFDSVFRESQESREMIDPNNFSIDYSDGCTSIDELTTDWKDTWNKKFASDSIDISKAKWVIYFSPPCKNSITASVYRHWDNGSGGLDYYYYFEFNNEKEVEWLSVSWIHSSTVNPPLKGWNY